MKNYANSSKKKTDFITDLPTDDLEGSDIESRCKFNFSFFDSNQAAGNSLSNWSHAQGTPGICTLENLMVKIVEYTKQSLVYWQNKRVGGGGLKTLEIYGNFPKKSDFTHPSFVPHDVSWARFRLGNKVRLIGFTIPKAVIEKIKSNKKTTSIELDTNTFYVVFIDENHCFYKVGDESD